MIGSRESGEGHCSTRRWPRRQAATGFFRATGGGCASSGVSRPRSSSRSGPPRGSVPPVRKTQRRRRYSPSTKPLPGRSRRIGLSRAPPSTSGCGRASRRGEERPMTVAHVQRSRLPPPDAHRLRIREGCLRGLSGHRADSGGGHEDRQLPRVHDSRPRSASVSDLAAVRDRAERPPDRGLARRGPGAAARAEAGHCQRRPARVLRDPLGGERARRRRRIPGTRP